MPKKRSRIALSIPLKFDPGFSSPDTFAIVSLVYSSVRLNPLLDKLSLLRTAAYTGMVRPVIRNKGKK